MQEARRVRELPSYLFATIEQKVADYKARGVDIISFGIGDPDRPTPQFIIDRMAREIYEPAHHQYPSSWGMMAYREAVARWYKRRFDVELEPKNEVVALLGSKEGIANISYCYLDPGDLALVPDPGYPVYSIGAGLAGANVHWLPLTAERGFLPDLDSIPTDVARRAKLLWLNYPNNPTGAVAPLSFFEEAVQFAQENNILICHDAAYTEVSYDGYIPPSFLQVKGAKDVAVEFNSLSKPYNMTGWRLGFAVGNSRVVSTLARYKSNVDSGVFQAIQMAGVEALDSDQSCLEEMRSVYQKRRDLMISTFNDLGWHMQPPKASFYIWAPVPKGFTSASFAEYMLDRCGVIVTPGSGYGPAGEGWFRLSLTIPEERIREGAERIRNQLGKVEF